MAAPVSVAPPVPVIRPLAAMVVAPVNAPAVNVAVPSVNELTVTSGLTNHVLNCTNEGHAGAVEQTILIAYVLYRVGLVAVK